MLNGYNVVIPAHLADELKTTSQSNMHLPCVQISSLRFSEPLAVYKSETLHEDNDSTSDIMFTRCDEVYCEGQNDIIGHRVQECSNSDNTSKGGRDIERHCVNVNVVTAAIGA